MGFYTMGKRKLTPEQQKHKDIHDKMQSEHITICEYCGDTKQGLSFIIGASSKPDWTLNIGTGKMSCPKPECRAKAEAEKKALRDYDKQ